MSHSTRGHLAAMATILVWGSTFVVTKVLLKELTATQILVIRFFSAGLILLPFSRGFFRWSGWRTELRWFAAGTTGVTAYYLAENVALARTSATDVGLIVSTIPLLTAVAWFWKTKRSLAGGTWTGLAAASLGVMVTMGNGLILGRQPLGDLLALGAALSFTVYSLVIRDLPADAPPLVTVTRSFLWGTAAALPFLVFDGGWPRESVLFSLPVLESLVFLTLAASVAAYALWNHAIGVLGVVKTNAYIYTVPVVNTALGAWLLGESITVLTVVGCALVVGGVAWGNFSPPRAQRCPKV